MMWKDASTASLPVLSQHLLGEAEETIKTALMMVGLGNEI
jgi:hypothetical protein